MKRLAVLSSLVVLSLSSQAYDVKDRFTKIDDNFKTLDMLNEKGHDFLLDLKVGLNKDLQTFISDGKDASKVSGSDQAKLDAAMTTLLKYKDTEQNFRAGVGVGIPIFSFTAFGVKIAPDLRVSLDAGGLIGIKTEPINGALLATLIGVSTTLPDDAKAAMASYNNQAALNSVLAGGSINTYATNACAAKGCSASTNAALAAIPTVTLPASILSAVSAGAPVINVFSKLDVKAGPQFGYSTESNHFGAFSLYGMYRMDYLMSVGAAAIASNQNTFSGSLKNNGQAYLMTDIKHGYKWDNFSLTGSLEEIKLNKIKDSTTTRATLDYGTPMLMRLHADYTMDWSIFKLQPFAGVHKRTGYGFADGLYAGADIGTYVWGERIGLRFRGMLDNEHITLSPMIKMWLMYIDYSAKIPVKSQIDSVKVSAIHALNFRLFF